MPTQRSGKGRGNASPPAKDRPVKVVRVQKCQGQIWANRLEGGAEECEGEFSCTTHNYSHFYKTDSLAARGTKNTRVVLCRDSDTVCACLMIFS